MITVKTLSLTSTAATVLVALLALVTVFNWIGVSDWVLYYDRGDPWVS